MNKIRFAIVTLIVVLMNLGNIPSILAQDCPNVVIDDSLSATKLNRAAICNAAKPWSSGFKVYVFLTDYRPVNEDDWFTKLDNFEIGQTIRDSSGFKKTAIAFEASTVQPTIYTANITVGESLANTALWDDAKREQLKGSFGNALAGNVTEAFVQTITKAYQIAFPPIPTPLPPAPTQVIVQGPVTNVKVDTAPLAQGAGILIAVVVIAFVGFFLVKLVVIPLVQAGKKTWKYRTQIKILTGRVNNILLACEKLLAGTDATGTVIYVLWQAHGGQKYPERDKQVRKLLTSAMQALSKAFELRSILVKNAGLSLEDQVQSWEMIYLTVVGISERILSMDATQQEQLLNPMYVVERASVSDDLASQLDQIFANLQQDQSLRIEILVADVTTISNQGILGVVDQVKSMLHQLKEARETAKPALDAARSSLDQFSTSYPFQDVLGKDVALKYVNDLVAKANKAAADELWLDVSDLVKQITDAQSGLQALLEEFYSALKRTTQDEMLVAAIASEGFKLDQFSDTSNEYQTDLEAVTQSVLIGDYLKAGELTREAVNDMSHLLEQVKGLKALRDQNQQRLQELSTAVARSQAYLSQSAETAWSTLQTYPKSNWETVVAGFESAKEVIVGLFDDPADSKDLASSIGTANSMQSQQFKEAEKLLTEAFSTLGTAQQGLESVVHQLEQVHAAEKNAAQGLVDAKRETQKAEARRDSDNTKVSDQVDTWIKSIQKDLKLAETLINEREFTRALALIDKSRKVAAQAYAEADQSIASINAANEQLRTTRTETETLIATASSEQEQLIAAARTGSTMNLVRSMIAKLSQAKVIEKKIGGEDKAWLNSINAAITAYKSIQSDATQALNAVRNDKRDYEMKLREVGSSIDKAQQEILSALNEVRDSDAQGAGSMSLSKAQSILIGMPAYGTSVEMLDQAIAVASQAQQYAQNAYSEAHRQISEVQAARRRAQEEQDRLDRQRRDEEHRRQQQMMSSISHTSSHSSSFGSSSHSSSMGSSSRGSSMGASKR